MDMQPPASSNGSSRSGTGGVQLGNVLAKPSQVEEYEYGQWRFRVVKDHIMQSNCTCAGNNTCGVCTFERSFAVLPEMVFDKNILSIQHVSGATIRFDCRGALSMVDYTQSDSSIKVSATSEWQESRRQLTRDMPAVQDWDWTFGTKYTGDVDRFQVTPAPPNVRIDLDKLRQREPILFYDELPLFEDELADHGCAVVSCRVRVMASGFFVLLRYYLRVDHVMVRLYDTRIYWAQSSPHLIREWSCRECKWADMHDELRQTVMQPDQCWQSIPLKEEKIDLLTFGS